MSENQKPTFGVAINQDRLNEVIERRNQRPEIGAIWKKLSRKNNNEFLSVEVTLSEDKLKELLSKVVDGKVKINLVGFTNKFQNGMNRRPAFRLYEEIGLNNEQN